MTPTKRSVKSNGFLSTSCLITLLIFLAMVVAGVSYGVMKFKRLVVDYTDEAPLQFEEVTIAEDELNNLLEKIALFANTFEEEGGQASLALSDTEINALIWNHDELQALKGKVKVDFSNGTMNGTVSIPIDNLIPGLGQGRFLNGSASFDVSSQNGIMVVAIESLVVKGKKVPEMVMAELRKENLAQELYKNAEHAKILQQIDSVRIVDKIIKIETL